MTTAIILRDVRFQVCRALVTGGHPAALAAVAAGSIRLSRLVFERELLWSVAFRNLLQVSVNIGLVRVFGRRVVQHAIDAGPCFYYEIEQVAA